MSRPQSRFVCSDCAAVSLRWEGQCRTCGGWNTLVETVVSGAAARRERERSAPVAAPGTTTLLEAGPTDHAARLSVGIGELDRVLGGGLVAGSLVLLGGEPGIGKSTLLLALAGAVGGPVVYASGEESVGQLGMRAARLGLREHGRAGDVHALAETSVERILAAAESAQPSLLVVDSVQTLTADELEGPAGSVGQVRAAAAQLQQFAKQSGVPVVLVGHVTKDGTLAGPKTLEHLVDVVLTLEGDRYAGLRLLRSSKNRYGSTEEIGVFEMAADGLREVPDPGLAFVEARSQAAPGVSVAATLEGSRPLLVEVQALVAPAGQANPRRTAAGVDPQRLALLIAVLGRRAGIGLASHDVYASLVGGVSIDEPALDLPLALALASSLRDRPLLGSTVSAGEVGLTGELRGVNGLERRLREAARLGFERAIVPRPAGGARAARNELPERVDGLKVVGVETLREALAAALAPPAGPSGEVRQARVPVLDRTGSPASG
ncbi:MAG TPA: DNA repair protein RadA [Candidatus Limnocylindrales bacterium]|jgi:DNA repair protein RadA/Sms|nr:DNA repair protein RadA [Candidatus Limnocylindrales bacterium]